MLFSNTLVVEAAFTTTDISTSYTVTMDIDFGNAFQSAGAISSVSGSGLITNGSGSISVSGGSGQIVSAPIKQGGMYHVKIPCTLSGSYSGTYSPTDYAAWVLFLTNFSVSGCSDYDNVCLTDSEGKILSVGVPSSLDGVGQFYSPMSDLWSANAKIYKYFYLEFDCQFDGKTGVGTTSQLATLVVSFTSRLYARNASEADYQGQKVVDAAANQSLDAIEQSSQDIATSVTSDTGGGLLATIKNFFGGFFTNIFNTILGLFVPDSTYFSTWFNNLNTLLSEKLGMLYAPFDLLISTLNAIYSADTTEPGITFPGITWNGETVIEPYTFYFSSLGEDFQNLRDAVYFATDVVLLFAFLHLLQKKIALVITGSEVNG